MTAEVRDILERIHRLSQAELAGFWLELERADQQEWLALLRTSRRLAIDRGLDDATIARAVEDARREIERHSPPGNVHHDIRHFRIRVLRFGFTCGIRRYTQDSS
jgi:hypothetical protein